MEVPIHFLFIEDLNEDDTGLKKRKPSYRNRFAKLADK